MTHSPSDAPTKSYDPYAAWRYRNFTLYTTGNVFWWMGRQMLGVIIGWEVYSFTNSATALGLIGLLEALPVILLALPAGDLADRLNRKYITIASVATIALCTFGLSVVSQFQQSIPHWGWLTQCNQIMAWLALLLGEQEVYFNQPAVPLLFLLYFFSGVALAVGGPARLALLPSIIPIKFFANAMAWNSSIVQISSMTGPALGGLLLWLLSGKPYMYSAVYFLDAVCIACFVLCLSAIKYTHQPHHKVESTRKSLMAGFSFITKQQLILATITLDMFAILLGGAVILLPVFAKDILHVGPFGLGCLRAAPAVGSMLMALLLAHLPPMRNAGRTLLLAVAGFGVATVVFGLSQWFWLSMLAMFMTGLFDNISVVIRHTLLQVLAPDSLRGRVSAINNVFISVSNEIGSFESGTTAAIFGPVLSVVGGGIGSIIVVIIVAVAWPQVLKFDSLEDAKPEEEDALVLTKETEPFAT